MPPTLVEPTGAERAAIEAKRGLAPCQRLYTVEGVEVRASDDPDSALVDFVGHASVTGTGYDMYGGPDKGGWIEFVDRGAFKKTLAEKPDVAFLLNHTGLTMARTKAGSLTLREDSVGLEAKAQLNTARSDVNDVVIAMRDGNLDEMSFAFRVKRQTWLDAEGEEVPWWDLAGIERHITEVDIHKGDVSVVNYGANPHTDAKVRTLAGVLLTVDRASLDEADIRSAIEYLTGLLPKEPDMGALEAKAALWAFNARYGAA